MQSEVTAYSLYMSYVLQRMFEHNITKTFTSINNATQNYYYKIKYAFYHVLFKLYIYWSSTHVS